MFDSAKAKEAQSRYCQERGYPHFAPSSGRCYRCGRDIYQQVEWPDGRNTGISVEAADSTLITGCPHCRRSYCD